MPLLASINEDILALLHQETVQRSELLIAELTSVLQLYMTLGADIFTIARCSQKVGLPPPYKQDVIPARFQAEKGEGPGLLAWAPGLFPREGSGGSAAGFARWCLCLVWGALTSFHLGRKGQSKPV